MFQNGNLYHFLNSQKQDTAFSKNTYYRFLNESRFNWKRFITLLAGRVTEYFNSLTKPDRVVSLVLDDSVILRERSKKMELLSHVIHKTLKGFNMLTLGWTDGHSFVPVGFNMMASADAGKWLMPASGFIDKRKAGYKSCRDAIHHKLEWLRRKSNDLKTICELFYICCDDIQDIELSTALGQLLKILCDGIRKRAIAITNEVKKQLINWFVSRPAFIKALYPDLMWEV